MRSGLGLVVLFQSIRRVVEQLAGGRERAIKNAGDMDFGKGHVPCWRWPSCVSS